MEYPGRGRGSQTALRDDASVKTSVSPLGAWILAARPRTLPAALAPVALGSALAQAEGVFRALPAAAALLGALLLQISVNLANDYFDALRGVDSADRLGPLRVTQSGLIAAQRVKAAVAAVLLLAMAPGLYLTSIGGWPIAVAGGAAVLAVLAYSGGPYPLASHGLGDVAVFMFFGPVAVCGTYYVQAGSLSWLSAALAVPVGFLITAVLVVNNLRDIQTDARAAKRSLAVLLGERATRLEYTLLAAGAYLVPVLLPAWSPTSRWVLLPLVSLPWAACLTRAVWTRTGSSLNPVLARTAKLALFHALLLSLGLAGPGL